ncbi:MAG: prepilin-type N-terminal cleavage/methylation domain-containing protein [Phycisphaerae bacterium]|nr:prepilin-type N-terminal cleavage/methylation domain-containing protein [Phycisphaerae bacterium]
MNQRIRVFARGVTLLEVAVGIAILAVASIGAINYQYHATRQSLVAQSEMTATRVAQLLLEDWKSRGGDETYNPEELGLGFVAMPAEDAYRIKVDNLPMTVYLDWKDVEKDEEAGVTLREISVEFRWRLDRTDGAIRGQDPEYVMTTLVRRDQSSG